MRDWKVHEWLVPEFQQCSSHALAAEVVFHLDRIPPCHSQLFTTILYLPPPPPPPPHWNKLTPCQSQLFTTILYLTPPTTLMGKTPTSPFSELYTTMLSPTPCPTSCTPPAIPFPSSGTTKPDSSTPLKCCQILARRDVLKCSCHSPLLSPPPHPSTLRLPPNFCFVFNVSLSFFLW